MHETTQFSIWEYSAIIFVVVLVSKLVSKKTGTVDVLWLIVAGAEFHTNKDFSDRI